MPEFKIYRCPTCGHQRWLAIKQIEKEKRQEEATAEIIQEIYKMTCTSPTHTPARRHLRDMLDYFEDIDEKNFGEHQPELLRLAAQIVRVLEVKE